VSNFEFVFSLFGLLLGLSLAKVLGGFGRTVQKRRKVRIGWLTPMLGLIVLLDICSFWLLAWALRTAIPVEYVPMMCGLVICGLYYLVATLVFPDDLDEWPDLDAYYVAHKRRVIGGVIGCNALALGAEWALGINLVSSVHNRASVAVFVASAAALVLAKGKRANVGLLAFVALQYPVGAWLRTIGW
jgi:hypothetical protein